MSKRFAIIIVVLLGIYAVVNFSSRMTRSPLALTQ